MKRAIALTTVGILSAALIGAGCEKNVKTASADMGSAHGEALQATGQPGIGAANGTGTTASGVMTGTSTTGGTAANGEASAQLAAAEEKHDEHDEKHHGEHADAVAKVAPAAGAPKDMQVTGTVKFAKAEHGVNVMVHLKGFAPDSKHGFHIHEKADLSGADLKTAGGHFNPEGKKHGGAEGDERHGGDLGNITADDKGEVKTTIMAHGVTIDGEKDGIIGRSVIVHEKRTT